MSLFKPNKLSPNFEQVYDDRDIIFSFNVNANMSNVKAYQIIIYDDNCLNDLDNYDDYMIGVLSGNFENSLSNGEKGFVRVRPQDLEKGNIKLVCGKNYVWKLRVYEDTIGASNHVVGINTAEFDYIYITHGAQSGIPEVLFGYDIIHHDNQGHAWRVAYTIADKSVSWNQENKYGIGFEERDVKIGTIVTFDKQRNIFGFLGQTFGLVEKRYSNICFTLSGADTLVLEKIDDNQNQDEKETITIYRNATADLDYQTLSMCNFIQNCRYIVRSINGNENFSGTVTLMDAFIKGPKFKGNTFVGQNFISGSTNKVMWIDSDKSEIFNDNYFGYEVNSEYHFNPDKKEWSLENLNNSDFLPFGTEDKKFSIDGKKKTFKNVPKQKGRILRTTMLDYLSYAYQSIDDEFYYNLGFEKMSNQQVFRNGVICDSLKVEGDDNFRINTPERYQILAENYYIDFKYSVYVKEGSDIKLKNVSGKRMVDKLGNFISLGGGSVNGGFNKLIVNDENYFINNDGKVLSVAVAGDPYTSLIQLEENILSDSKVTLYSPSSKNPLKAEWITSDHDNTKLCLWCCDMITDQYMENGEEKTRYIIGSEYKALDIFGKEVIVNEGYGIQGHHTFIKPNINMNDEKNTLKCYDARNWKQDIYNFITGQPDDPFIQTTDPNLEINTDVDIAKLSTEEPSGPSIEQGETTQDNYLSYTPRLITGNFENFIYASIYDLKIASLASFVKRGLDNQEIYDKFYIRDLGDKEFSKLNSGNMWIKIYKTGSTDENNEFVNGIIEKYNYNTYKKILSSGQEKINGEIVYYVILNPYEGVFSCSNLSLSQDREKLENWYETVKVYTESLKDSNFKENIENVYQNLKYSLSYRQREKIKQVSKPNLKKGFTQIILENDMNVHKYQYGDKDNLLLIEKTGKAKPLVGNVAYKSICCTNLLNNKFDQQTIYMRAKEKKIKQNDSYIYIYYSDDQKIESTNNITLIFPGKDSDTTDEYNYFDFRRQDFKKMITEEIDGKIKTRADFQYIFDISKCCDRGYPADKNSIVSVDVKIKNSTTLHYPPSTFEYSQGKLKLSWKKELMNTDDLSEIQIQVVFNNISADILQNEVKFRGGLQKIIEYDSETGRTSLGGSLPCIPNESWKYQILNVYGTKMTSDGSSSSGEKVGLSDYLQLGESGILGEPTNKTYETLSTNFSPYEVYSTKFPGATQTKMGVEEFIELQNCKFFIQKQNVLPDINKTFSLDLFNDKQSSTVYSLLENKNGVAITNKSVINTPQHIRNYSESLFDKISEDTWIFNCTYIPWDWPNIEDTVEVSPKHSLSRPQTRYKMYTGYIDAVPDALFSMAENRPIKISAECLSQIERKIDMGLENNIIYDQNVRFTTSYTKDYNRIAKYENDNYKIKKYKFLIYSIDSNGYYYETDYKYDDHPTLECFYLTPGRYKIISTIVNEANKEKNQEAFFEISKQVPQNSELQISYFSENYDNELASFNCKEQLIELNIQKIKSMMPNENIRYLQVYRKVDKSALEDFDYFGYKAFDIKDDNYNIQNIDKIYDYSIKNNHVYKYIIVLKTDSYSYSYETLSIKCKFNKYSLQDIKYDFKLKSYVTDSENKYLFNGNVDFSPVQTSSNTGYAESMGEYGKINKGNLQIDSGSLSLITTNLDNIIYNNWDPYYSSQNLDFWNQFLSNKRPKILRDTKGNSWIILVQPGFDLITDYKNKFYVNKASFQWVEVLDKEMPILQIKNTR